MVVLIGIVVILLGLMRMLSNASANISNLQEEIYNSTKTSIGQAYAKTRQEQDKLGLSDEVAAKRFQKRANHLADLHHAHLYGGSENEAVQQRKQLKEQADALSGNFKKKSKLQIR